MRQYPESRYIVLQESISAPERRKMERTLSAVLLRIPPAEAFVERLGEALVAEASVRYARYQQHRQILRMLGVVGGSVLSIAGGIVLWSVARRRRYTSRDGLATGSPAHAAASVGSV